MVQHDGAPGKRAVTQQNAAGEHRLSRDLSEDVWAFSGQVAAFGVRHA